MAGAVPVHTKTQRQQDIVAAYTLLQSAQDVGNAYRNAEGDAQNPDRDMIAFSGCATLPDSKLRIVEAVAGIRYTGMSCKHVIIRSA